MLLDADDAGVVRAFVRIGVELVDRVERGEGSQKLVQRNLRGANDASAALAEERVGDCRGERIALSEELGRERVDVEGA